MEAGWMYGFKILWKVDFLTTHSIYVPSWQPMKFGSPHMYRVHMISVAKTAPIFNGKYLKTAISRPKI